MKLDLWTRQAVFKLSYKLKTREEVSCCGRDSLGLTLWLWLSLPAEAGFLPKSQTVPFLALSMSYSYPFLHYTHPVFNILSFWGLHCHGQHQQSTHTRWRCVPSSRIVQCFTARRVDGVGRCHVSTTGHIASAIYLHRTSQKGVVSRGIIPFCCLFTLIYPS